MEIHDMMTVVLTLVFTLGFYFGWKMGVANETA